MAYTRVSGARSAKAALAYAMGHGHGHNGNRHRNLAISTTGGLIPGIPFYKQFERNHLSALYETKIEVHRIVLSYSLSEFNPTDEEDIAKADQLAQRFCKEIFPGHLAVCFTQNDGVGGKLHTHIILSNINSKTHKALDHCRTFSGHGRQNRGLKEVFNEFARKQQDLIKLDVGRKALPEEISEHERGIIERADNNTDKEKVVPVHRDILKPIIREEMEHAVSRDDFRKRMADRGIDVEYRTNSPLERTNPKHGASRDHGDYILYSVDPGLIPEGIKKPRNLKSKSYKLGTDYGIQELDRHIRENQKHLGDDTEMVEDDGINTYEESRINHSGGYVDHHAEDEFVQIDQEDEEDYSSSYHEEYLIEPDIQHKLKSKDTAENENEDEGFTDKDSNESAYDKLQKIRKSMDQLWDVSEEYDDEFMHRRN